MEDLYNELQFVELADTGAWSADAYSKYLDSLGLVAVGFLVKAKMTTADGTNYLLPALYGTNSATPGTFTNYTPCAAGELNGAFSAMNSAAGFTQFVAVKQHLYRYYCVFLNEVLTAVADGVEVVAVCKPANLPQSTWTATTGAVT